MFAIAKVILVLAVLVTTVLVEMGLDAPLFANDTALTQRVSTTAYFFRVKSVQKPQWLGAFLKNNPLNPPPEGRDQRFESSRVHFPDTALT